MRKAKTRAPTGASSEGAGTAGGAPAGADSSPLRLQQLAGNAAVADYLAGAQAKLRVGSTADPLEHEADAVAQQVVQEVRSGAVVAPDAVAPPKRAIRRRTAGPAATTPAAGGGEANVELERSVDAVRGGGEPLHEATRAKLEPAFGTDFEGVRVHTGPQATQLNDAVGAEAFTVGQDIFFRDAVPDVHDPLLAHELTHVVQQGAGDDTAHRHPVIRRRATGRPLAKVQAYRGRKGLVEDEGVAVDIPAGTELIVNDEDDKRRRGKSDDPKARPGYVQIRHSQGDSSSDDEFRRLWVLATALDLGPVSQAGQTNLESGLDYVEQGDKLFGAYKGFANKKVYEDTGADDTTSDNMSYASDSGDIASMVIGLASAVRKWNSTDVNAADKVESALNGIDSLGKGAKGVAGLIKTASGAEKGDTESDVSGGLAGFADIFKGLKETYKVVRKVVDLVISATNDKKAKTGQDVAKDIGAIAIGLLETAKSGVSSAKMFLDTFGSGASAAIQNAVPGFGIALGAADLIVRSVDLVSGIVHAIRMRDEKRDLKQQLGGKKGKSSKKEAQAIITRLEAKQTGGEELSDDEQAELASANDYLFTKGLQWINDKRRNRALLKMSVALTKASGDVATLGGASAPVGAGLKAGALALDVGASVFRKFKQWGRDTKERKEGKGKSTGFYGMFDSDKSTKKKTVQYHRMVDKIFNMILAVDAAEGLEGAAVFLKIEKYVAAMGMHIKKLYARRDDPAKLRAEMIAALKKRE